MESLLSGNNYYNNTAGAIQYPAAGLNLDSPTPDTDVVTYTSAIDKSLLTSNLISIANGHSTTGTWLKGGVQSAGAGGGGEHSSASVH